MSPQSPVWLRIVSLVAVIVACSDGKDAASTRAGALEPTSPAFTPSSGGYKSTPLARSTFSDPKDPMYMLKRKTGEWHLELKARPGLDVAVQTISFPAGSASGWHSHSGPVFIAIVKGTLRFYEGDDPSCGYVEKTAGQVVLDLGEHPHIARNESADEAQTMVTYLAPPGAPLRVDEPRPGNCPF
jgi:quercetin dioxygenase-like cupin family protein